MNYEQEIKEISELNSNQKLEKAKAEERLRQDEENKTKSINELKELGTKVEDLDNKIEALDTMLQEAIIEAKEQLT